jgi:hypothetical protein
MQALQWLDKVDGCAKIFKDCQNGFVGAIKKDGSNAFVDWVRENKLEHVRPPLKPRASDVLDKA